MDDDVVFEGPEAVRRHLHESCVLEALIWALAVLGVLTLLVLVTGCGAYERPTPPSTVYYEVHRDDDRLTETEREFVLETLDDGVFDPSDLDLSLEKMQRLGDEVCALAMGSHTWAGFELGLDTLVGDDLDVRAVGYASATFMCHDLIHSLEGHPATTR